MPPTSITMQSGRLNVPDNPILPFIEGDGTGPDAVTDLARVFWNQLRVLGSTMGTNEEFGEVAALFRAGAVRPVVDRVFTPEDAVSAYQRLEGAEQFGKIVIDWR